MAVSVLTNDFKVNAARQLIDDVTEGNTYFLVASNHNPVVNVSILPTAPNNDIRSLVQDVYFNMIFGKRLTDDNMRLMILNSPWVSNTVYDMYDDNNPNLLDLSYYVMINEGTYTHVYKCMDNNNGNPSTAQPTFSDISTANDELYELSDGYRWKYMFSSDDVVIARFGSSAYFPITANTDVENNAVPGALNVIHVDYIGAGYANWLLGQFAASDIRINGSPTTYALSTNTSINTTNNFYKGCVLYLASGDGVGQFKNVISYSVTNLGNFITIDSPFTIPPKTNDNYEIYPNVVIVGGGSETQNAVARAIVNAAGNSIARVEMLQVGQGFQYASANVIADPVVSVVAAAQVRPIYSPPNGHGYDPANELGGTFLGISGEFDYAEGNTIPAVNSYKQISLMRSPTFSNVKINMVSVFGSFEGNETIYKLNPIEIASDININTLSNIITSGVANLATFSPNDFIYFSNGTFNQLATVETVTNSTYITITTNSYFSCTSSYAYFPQETEIGTVVGLTTANSITISNTKVFTTNNDLIIGQLSGALGTISDVQRSGVSKGFQTFIGNFQYSITYTSGTFQQNENVYQGTSLANATMSALVHSVNNNVLLVTQQIGTVNTIVSIIGANSGAIATVNSIHFPEIVYGTGEILYVENITPVTRNNQIDTIKLIVGF